MNHGIRGGRLPVDLKTGGGTSHSTVSRVSADITFHDRTESMSFLLAPPLTQNLYLGANFVRKVGVSQDLELQFLQCREREVTSVDDTPASKAPCCH